METFEKRELLDMIQGFNTIDFIKAIRERLEQKLA